jgi:hypothetical protein
MLCYDRCIQKGKELIGTRIDLPGHVLVRCRTGSSGRSEQDPGLLGSDLKLNFGYAVEDIKCITSKKNQSIWWGRLPGTWSSIWGSSAGHESSV